MMFTEFLTVDELDDSLRSISVPFTIGKSESGRDILCSKVGTGKRTILVFGFPHANEPIGSLTCLDLIERIKSDPVLENSFTWYVIPCADPDGAMLNQGWFKGPFTIDKYARHFYRGKPCMQTDWSFPVKYKDFVFQDSPAHVRALAELIKRIRPDVVYPIHNAGFGGAYFFVSRPMPGQYYEEVIKLCHKLGIPLDLGEPEEAFMKELQKPFFLDFGFEDYYEFVKSNGKDPVSSIYHGTTSKAYARTINPASFGLVGEVPYIFDPKTQDTHSDTRTRRQNIIDDLTVREKLIRFIKETLMLPGINKQSVFFDTLTTYVTNACNGIELERRNAKKEAYDWHATIAETFTAQVISRFYYALRYGELFRLLNESGHIKEIQSAKTNVDKEIKNIEGFISKHSTYKTVPIENMIQLQTQFLLITLKHLKS
ncbi:MAG TPA: M14 family zinc carboxypeptidase [Candidatus Nanoarchaeia archaeon]|nr:M14 family zinc carboxypeptidase [Candidatus Nanoarchaeia archaeon]